MESRNYILISDSAVEGHLADQIYKRPFFDNKKETWVEAKWADISFNNKGFIKEILGYLINYLSQPIEKRFNLFIFTRKLQNPPYHNQLLQIFDSATIGGFYKKLLKEAENSLKEIIASMNQEDLINFLEDITIYQVNYKTLKMQVDELKDYKQENSIYTKICNNILSKIQKPCTVNGQEKVIGNIAELVLGKFWGAETNIREISEVYQTIQYPPPYILYKEKIFSIFPFDGTNPLTGIIDIDTITEERSVDWLKDNNDRRWLIWLINRALDKICRIKGLWRDKEGKYYYFKRSMLKSHSGKLEWIKDKKYKRFVVNKYESFYFHRAIKIYARIIDDIVYVVFFPTKTFTADGENLLEGKKLRKLEEKFRKAQYTHNQNLLNDVQFWDYFLFRDKNDGIQKFDEFFSETEKDKMNTYRTLRKLIKIKPLLKLDVDWKINDDITPIYNEIKELIENEKNTERNKQDKNSKYKNLFDF